jgi:hypothetical protein
MPADILKRAGRAAAAGLLAVAAAALASSIAGRVRGPVVVDMIAELPRGVLAGFYPPERAGDLTFAWTSARGDLALTGLPRDREWTCAARLRAARSAPPIPRLEVLVDGLRVLSREAPNDFEDVRFDLPARASRGETRLSLSAAPTVVPGPQDRRPLGVQVDRISCAPSDRGAMPSSRAAFAASLAVAGAFAVAAVLAGAPLAAAVAIAALVAGAQLVPLDSGIAAYSPFVPAMARLGLWITTPLLALVFVAGLIRRRALSNFAVSFAFVAGAALYLQLLGLLHPAKPPIDVVFQAHRFDAVLAGNYFFTQAMPGGVRFPYAIGLYLFAAPWARFTTDHALLLRVIVCAADAVAYVLLFWLAIRVWRDRAAAAVALLLAFALPIAFEVIGNANLTNEFGHAASTAALVIAAALPGARRPVQHAILLTAVCTLALIAHVSTFALLVAMLAVFAANFWFVGLRRAAVTLLSVTVLSAGIAFAGYYGHFMDVYKEAVRVRTAAPASTAPPPADVRGQTAASLPMRVVDAVERSASWAGWPLLVLAAAGAWRIRSERRHDPAALAIVSCVVAYVLFVGIAVMRVQPAFQRYTVEFVSRVVLTTSPGLLLLAGAGASWGLRAGMWFRAATIVLLIAAFAIAGREWVAWFA